MQCCPCLWGLISNGQSCWNGCQLKIQDMGLNLPFRITEVNRWGESEAIKSGAFHRERTYTSNPLSAEKRRGICLSSHLKRIISHFHTTHRKCAVSHGGYLMDLMLGWRDGGGSYNKQAGISVLRLLVSGSHAAPALPLISDAKLTLWPQ